MSQKKLRWGILSTARIGMNALAPAFKDSKEAELIAISSRDKTKAQEAADRLGIPRAYGSYEELLEDPDIDIVYIPLPNGMHPEWAVKAAQKGKHILCEKPIANDAELTRRMIEDVGQYGVVLMEAFMWRFHPQHHKVREIIASGELGRARLVRIGFSFWFDSPNFRFDPAQGGGAMMDVGCYCVNISRFIFDTEPVRAYASAEFDPKNDVDLSLSGHLLFPDNTVSLIDCSFRMAGRQEYEVICEKGMIEVPLAILPGAGPARIYVTGDSRRQEATVEGLNQYTAEIDHLSACVRERKMPVYPPESSLKNMKILDALIGSARSGKAVELSL